jgi:carbamoyltransferase
MASTARVILGINSAYHESSAALLVDGQVLAAAEEERFTGRKHGKAVRVDNADQLPVEAINWCLRDAGISWSQVDAIGYSLDPRLRRVQACMGSEPPHAEFGRPLGEALFQHRIARVPRLLRSVTQARLHFIPHHLCHAWYAMGSSPFERAAILVIDGIGEGASISLGRGDRKWIAFAAQTLFPHSLGLAWEKIACFLKLTEYDACKVMALAGLIPRQHISDLEQVLGWGPNGLEVDEAVFDLEHPRDFAGLERHLGCRSEQVASDPLLRARIAAAMQQATEARLLDIAADLQARCGEADLAYAGGVALNCRANADLASRGPFQRIHIGPAAHDAGTALGAAWYLHTRLTGQPVPEQNTDLIAASGPWPETTEALAPEGWHPVEGDDALESAASWLASGEALAWLDGRCEFGPRALGRRSLLASAHPHDAAHRVNTLKGRHEYEPLALSVPEERADDLFDIPPAGRGLAALMLVTVRVRSGWRERLSHLVHSDGTVRLQIVSRLQQPRFHSLLHAMERLTGLPLVVNTSLNPRGRPMPAGAEQAWPTVEALGLRRAFVSGQCWSAPGASEAVRRRTPSLRVSRAVARVG